MAARSKLSIPSLDRLFGVEAERKISESGVRNVFTPHQPISEATLLSGRKDEIKKVAATLNTPGQHVLLYGERGVGKSSLANVCSLVLGYMKDLKLFVKRCDQSDTFESIMQAPLSAVGADLSLTGVTETVDNKFAADAKLIKGERAESVVQAYQKHHSLSPSVVAEAIQGLEALMVVDEADAIANSEDRRKLAELIKLLSDAGSQFKMMVVGIASTGAELTAAHPSVQRCLRETKLGRMSNPELKQIVDDGSEKLSLHFHPKVTQSIVALSAGFPHFTQLMALKCAEEAIAEDRTYIEEKHLKAALSSAVQDAEGTLKRAYEDATRSFGTQMYEEIVSAAATITSEEFNAAALREAIERRTGEAMSQGSLNNYLQRLVSVDGSRIMQRTAKGVYRLSDPRMASYVRMRNMMEPPD
ncbi:hypothetical protein GCM10009721_34040 [Terrabacter tumescens]|uniref:Novel STAND NTPase 1 domain-containing protein n=1 Tax=Terrabacter tumescens TaxID=60443 RepID=A0ABQ2I8P0_9MICO|nr:AAA family ATPase [Terrabacter tumescens]GGN03845.1 hypothetical protein GCM10009721_34040 [Terrabacter tumescens]